MIKENIQRYQSLSVGGGDIELNVSDVNSNTTAIVVSNLNFNDNRSSAMKYLLISLLLLVGSLVIKSIIVHITVIVLISIQIYCFTCLVESETITITKDFGVQLLTTYTLGRTNSLFIQFAHIHNVIISEVIQNLKVTFMLSFQTKGSWYEKRPIIPIMHAINPRLDVLKIVYNILRKYT